MVKAVVVSLSCVKDNVSFGAHNRDGPSNNIQPFLFMLLGTCPVAELSQSPFCLFRPAREQIKPFPDQNGRIWPNELEITKQ